MLRVDTRIEMEIVASLERCPRCLQSHPELGFKRLRSPSPQFWSLWTMCPVTQEPIMVSLDPGVESRFQRAEAEVQEASQKLVQLLLEQRAREDTGEHARSEESEHGVQTH